ncbi:hypothetical protein, partial [Geminicoccus flavidas]|uniref:hypothetical protein n=1 Tax=Geminicoccus flavidas TaxID=2506407 RepID=UPI001F274C0C
KTWGGSILTVFFHGRPKQYTRKLKAGHLILSPAQTEPSTIALSTYKQLELVASMGAKSA